jgi:hypothetical protein
MTMLLRRCGLVLGLCALLGVAQNGCDGEESDAATGGEAGSAPVVATVSVSGSVVDFQTGMPIATSATLSLSGLNQEEPPAISVMGATFEVSGIAPFSAFNILSGAPPDYRDTYNVLTEVKDANVTGIEALVISEAFLAELQTGFGVMPSASGGIVLARAVDDAGMPRVAVSATAFTVNDAAPPTGPFFLDDALAPAPNANETSASGYVVFYDVPPGRAEFGAAMGSGYTISGASSPVAVGKVTIVELTVTDGAPVIPTNVSFTNDVVPIFEKRGCTACHSGSNIGADLGDLALNVGDNKVYDELTNEVSMTYKTTRVNLMVPEESLVLRMPSAEDPPDAHPNITFTGPSDADYLTLLGWITEGAKQN